MNYRKLYEKVTGVKLPKDFQIHHIDFDRANNNINNLVALPKKLHQQYHYYLNLIDINNFPKQISNDYHSLSQLEAIELYIDKYGECFAWMNHRDYLLGKIPKFNTLTY